MAEESNVDSFNRNKAWSKPGPYVTKLSPQDEEAFQKWAKKNPELVKGELGPTSDYDVRGRWLAEKNGDPDAKLVRSKFDGKLHANDKWKTPYHRTFSRESIYATPDAPQWKGDKLTDKSGKIVADETPGKNKVHPEADWDANDYKRHGLTPPPMYSLSKSPEFLKETTKNASFASGDPSSNAVAETDYSNPNSKIIINHPEKMDQSDLDHELTHIYQTTLSDPPKYVDPRSVKDIYNYGGWQGLIDARKQGKTIGDYNDEQQAAMVQRYDQLRQGVDAETLPPGKREELLKEYDLANQAMAPYIRELANMTKKGENPTTINTLPPPPAPPPAEQTGVFKPLPEFGGNAVDLSSGFVKKQK